MIIIATRSGQLWNKGKQVGQKAPLKLRDIWAIWGKAPNCSTNP
ncbi:integrase [Pseudomonas sp. B707]|nr:integrase [Pseudomonas sp. B707]